MNGNESFWYGAYLELLKKYESYVKCSLDRDNKWKEMSCIPEAGNVELQYDDVGMPTAWRWLLPF